MGSRRRTLALLGLAVSLASIAVLAAKVDARAVWAAMAGASVPLLLVSLLTKALGFLCLAARSRALFARMSRWPLAGFVKAHLLGFGANVVLPLRMGELLRVDELARRTGLARSICLGAVVVERGLDSLWILALAVALPAFATLGLPLPTLVVILLVLAGLALAMAAWLGAHPQRIATWAARFGRRFGERAGAWSERVIGGFAAGLSTVGSARRFTVASLWTMGYWLSGIAGVQIWIRAFDLELPWSASTVVIVFLALGSALPAAPGFVGTYDLAAVTALALFGVDTSRATALAVSGHFVSTVPATLVALVMFAGRIRGFAAAPSGGEGGSRPDTGQRPDAG